jgi:hypothetical protein
MAAATPAQASIGLYNKLVTLSFENDQEGIQQIKWRLQGEVRKHPEDAVAAVALVEACRMGGHQGEAVEEAKRVWGRHMSLAPQILENYLGQLVDLGLYGHAWEVFEYLLGDERFQPGPTVFVVAACAAVAAGDLAWLERIGVTGADAGSAALYLKVIDYSGLADHFAACRGIVNEIMIPLQCGVAVSAIHDPAEPDAIPGLFNYYFVPADRDRRRECERRIHQALEDYFIAEGLPPAVYLGYFDFMVTEVPFPDT